MEVLESFEFSVIRSRYYVDEWHYNSSRFSGWMRQIGWFFATLEVFWCSFVIGLVTFYKVFSLILSCLLRREFPLSERWKIGKGGE